MATVSYGSWANGRTLDGLKRQAARFVALATIGGVACWWAFPAEKVAETGAVGEAVHVAAGPHDTTTRGQTAVKNLHETLVSARTKLQSVPAMAACFQKQERIEGTLQPVNVMDVKVRREPLAVYMKWQKPDEGQELIWRHGAYDGKIVVSPAGWRRKVMPMVKIDPHGDMALGSSKRPITNMGIWNFTDRLLAWVEKDLLNDPSIEAVMTDGDSISGHPCSRFEFENKVPSETAPFQKTIVFVDRTLGVPVAFELYRWGTENGKQVGKLEESYLFRDLDLELKTTEADFDHANSAYQFTAK